MKKFIAILIGLAGGPVLAAPVVLHLEPSPVLFEMRLAGDFGQLTPGLGERAWLDFGKDLQPQLILFGSALGLATAHPGAAVSIAPGACYRPIGVCLDVGVDLGGSQGGLFQDFTWRKNFFAGVSFQPNFQELLHLTSPGA